jgi:hypothetical protein
MGTQKRGRYWYSRTRVPSELVPLVGQREVVRSLRTSSYREARVRCKLWEARVIELFARLHGEAQRMHPLDIPKLVAEYLRKSLEDGERDRLWRDDLDSDQHGAITSALQKSWRRPLRSSATTTSRRRQRLLMIFLRGTASS